MGAVYEAIDQRLDATVALKETLFADERLRRQFEREARLLARLHHPALPRVSDHFAEGGGEFLVMQFIPGGDLGGTLSQRRGPFPQEQVAMWADQLLDALDYLHTQEPQIVHRDIKPQNLKLTGRGQIVLLDFGLAKGQVHELSRVTTSASIFGYTPNYAPLEQVQGLGTDPRSDLYALAATLYHLVTGIKPPDALNRAASIVNGQIDPLQRADELNRLVSSAFAEVLQRGMSQNRDQRYGSAAEMRKALLSGSQDTLAVSGDVDTVLFAPAPTQLSAAGPTAPPLRTTSVSGETTVVRGASASKKGLLAAIGGVLLLLMAVAAGGFYVIKQRQNSSSLSQQPTPGPTPSVQIAQPSSSIEGGKSNEFPKANIAKEKVENPPKEKVESPAREAKKQPVVKKKESNSRDDGDDDEGDERAGRHRTAETPETPRTDEGDNVPTPYGPGGRRLPNVRVRTMPDGTRVMITPNGMRVVTYPDGTTRVFNPGARARRRP
jgi:serine/threonine protein kinase